LFCFGGTDGGIDTAADADRRRAEHGTGATKRCGPSAHWAPVADGPTAYVEGSPAAAAAADRHSRTRESDGRAAARLFSLRAQHMRGPRGSAVRRPPAGLNPSVVCSNGT
jgi:hypothetical protein